MTVWQIVYLLILGSSFCLAFWIAVDEARTSTKGTPIETALGSFFVTFFVCAIFLTLLVLSVVIVIAVHKLLWNGLGCVGGC